MTATDINSWQAVQDEVLSRIHSRKWKPGDLIPNEADLAVEFGCARATVNRALRALAETGILDRRRKAGTRVALHPVRKATLEIPIIRHEVEARNLPYGYALITAKQQRPPVDIRAKMNLASDATAMKVSALHLADNKPHVYEDRWINPLAAPSLKQIDFNKISANEWLVANATFTHGDIMFSAVSATPQLADILRTDIGAALFVIDRFTWHGDISVTCAKLVYAPGYQMKTSL